MSNSYINVSTTPFSLSNNTFDFVFLQNGSLRINLPPLFQQNNTINFINNNTVNNINIYTNENPSVIAFTVNIGSTLELFPAVGYNTWQVVNYGNDVVGSNSWNVGGNSNLDATGILGTTNDELIFLFQNNNLMATVGPTTITDINNPTVASDVSNKAYVDNSVANSWLKGGNTISGLVGLGSTNNQQWSLLYNSVVIGKIGPLTITGISNPTGFSDVANKDYVDTQVGTGWSSIGNSFGPGSVLGTTTADTWNLIYNSIPMVTIGPTTLTNVINPTNNLDVVNKIYVDSMISQSTWTPVGNSYPSGSLLGTVNPGTWNIIYNNIPVATVGPSTITGINTPVNPTDVANKAYVDSFASAWGPAGNTFSGGLLGTTNNNPFNLIVNNVNQLTVSNGSLTAPQSQLMSFGSSGSDSSTIFIKQLGQLNNTASTSHNGIKFANSSTTDAFYMGYATGGVFSIFDQTSGGVYTRLVNFPGGGFPTQLLFGLDNNNNAIINVTNPINSTDASNKNYVDIKYSTLIGSVVNQTSTAASTLILSAGVHSTYKVNFVGFIGSAFVNGSETSQIIDTNFVSGVGKQLIAVANASTINPALAILVITAPTTPGSGTFNYTVTLSTLATGYSIYVYN